MVLMISLIRGTCWRCEYQAVVGIGREDGTPIDYRLPNLMTKSSALQTALEAIT